MEPNHRRRPWALPANVLLLAALALALAVLPALGAPIPETCPDNGFGLAEAGRINDPALRDEAARTARAFFAEVTAKTLKRWGVKKSPERIERLTRPSAAYLDAARADAAFRLLSAGALPDDNRYFVYVDRNPAAQLLLLAVYDAGDKIVRFLGADLVSTGKLRVGEDSFITPTGVFENLPEHFGYRAQGTKNSKGWRGLGAKDSRVWDFGYQQGIRQFRLGKAESQMRLLMHATDPDFGEVRLGTPDSKGCVRVSAAANVFLDRRSILDRHYERLAETEKDMWLLKADRTPVSRPGSLLVIGDVTVRQHAGR